MMRASLAEESISTDFWAEPSHSCCR